MNRPELDELLKKSVAAFEALLPEQKKAHRLAQRKSWVIGEMMLEHLKMTREEAEGLYDKAIL